MKYIFVTGGVVSGLGKGICAASLGRLLKQRGLRVRNQKFDPYLNIDPGTMSPYQDVYKRQIPAGTRVLISEQTTVGKKNPYSREKLCPILAFYVEDDWHAACERCIEILNNEGVGHTMTIHSENKEVIRAFALRKPVSRLLVNVAAALGGVGATTSLPPALTLGCGAVGGSATSDNITPLNLMNIRRVAYGTKELSDLRGGHPAPDTAAPAASGSAAKLSACLLYTSA